MRLPTTSHGRLLLTSLALATLTLSTAHAVSRGDQNPSPLTITALESEATPEALVQPAGPASQLPPTAERNSSRQTPISTPTPASSTVPDRPDEELPAPTEAPSGVEQPAPSGPGDHEIAHTAEPIYLASPSPTVAGPSPLPTWGDPIVYPTPIRIDLTGVPHYTFKCDPPAPTPTQSAPDLQIRPGESLQVHCVFTSHYGFSRPINVACLTPDLVLPGMRTTCVSDPPTVTPPPDGTVAATLTHHVPETYYAWESCPYCVLSGYQNLALTPYSEGFYGIADGRDINEEIAVTDRWGGWNRMDWVVHIIRDETVQTPSPTPS